MATALENASKPDPQTDFFTVCIFPFKYFASDSGKEIFVPASQVADELCKGNLEPSRGWKQEAFVVDDPLKYSEWHYFHPYFRDVAFSRDSNQKEGIRYLLRKDYERLKVEYMQKDNEKIQIKTATVRVSSIDLHLFDNQIGFLTITTERIGDLTLGEYLKYNDLVRRVYPPFLAHPSDGERSNTDRAKVLSMIPEKVSLTGQCAPDIEECFKAVDLPGGAMYMSHVITELLSPLGLATAHLNPSKGEILYRPFTDDRMFVVSYFSNRELSDKLHEPVCGQLSYESSDEWYKMLFVDGGQIGVGNESMKRQLIRAHTYGRWAEGGTLFGMTRYSFVCLCDAGDFSRVHLRNHMKTMYYQIALIVLLRRAMLLRFSEDIKQLTRLLHHSGVTSGLRKEADRLQLDFIRFTNKYWLTEITPQEEGIDIYNQWTTLLDHDELYDKVKNEITELASYLRATIEHETNQNIEKLTEVGIPLSVLLVIWTLWIAFFGENGLTSIFNLHTTCEILIGVLKLIMIVVSLGALLYLRKPFVKLLHRITHHAQDT